jgi:hypothetical protein
MRGQGPIEHELGIDRVIREAIEKGDFDNLPGAGRPLDLGDYDPNDEWRVAFHVLKKAGETLPWIALGNEIATLRQRLQTLLDSAAAERQRGADSQVRQRYQARYLDQAQQLDALIASYNNQVPTYRLQQNRLPARVAEERFEAVWPQSPLI